MRREDLKFDKKSLKTVCGKTANFNEIAKDCVAFANARGGELYIGIEDDEEFPPIGQTIPENLSSEVVKRITQLTINVHMQGRKEIAKNGGEFLVIDVARQQSTIASTTKGQYYLRVGDESRPVLPDELVRFIEDRTAFSWETRTDGSINSKNCDTEKLSLFLSDIRHSNRVSSFVKSMPDQEILLHYLLIDERGMLTNLGILWLGKKEQRARLKFSPVVQYIKYDHLEQKVNKILWDDYSKNPKELIESIWSTVPDWREFTEISEGLWRKTIPAYDEKVVREILCNALVHRSYTTGGDIFINMYVDRMEVVNPGLFPIGVTANNILQKTQPRNEHLAKIFYDLHLMEREGSGYDLIYETLLSAGKDTPKPYEGDDYVCVTVYRNVINPETARLVDYIHDNFTLSQKNFIALGLILKANVIRNSELNEQLQFPNNERLRGYIEPLLDNGIIVSSGRGKGTKYSINPKLVNSAKSNIPTTLKTIEPYRLKELIREDLKYHPFSSVEDISKRLPDADLQELTRLVRKMANHGDIVKTGGRKYRKYRLP